MSGVIPTQQSRAADQWPPQSPGQRPYPEMAVVPSDKPLLQSLGASGTAIFSGIITSEEYNPDFYWRDGVKIFEQMLRSDAQIRAVRTVVEDPIKRAAWTITPGSEHPRDKEIASFVQSCLFTDMSYTTADGRVRAQTWSQILHHMLMHLWYGFMAFEVVWKKEDGWVKWAKWQPLLPRTVWRWWVGADTELVGIQQWTFKDWNYAFVDIPADKLLLFVHQQEGANFEGVSLLRTAYKHWWYKQQFEKIEAIGIERNAVVPPVITLPPNFTSEDIANAQTLGANMRANELSYATLPPGMLLDYPAHMQPFTSQVQPAIQYHDVMIARNVLAQFINLGSTETGAYALADAQQEMFLQALQAVAAYISDVVSSDAIKRLVDYNFSGVEVYPRLKCSRLANADISQVADALGKLKARDANFINPSPEVEDYLAEEFGLPKPARSPVTATNPTAQATPQRPDTQPGDHTDQPSRNVSPAGQKPGGNDANANATAQATAGNNAIAPAAPSDGGPALAETAEDVRLLREAVEAIAGLDAVERGVEHERKLLFNPNHDAKGRFAPGSMSKGPTSGGKRKMPTAKQKAAAVAKLARIDAARAKAERAAVMAGRIPPRSVEERIAVAKVRIKDAEKKLTASEKGLQEAQTRSERLRATNQKAIDAAQEVRHEAFVREFNSHSEAHDAIAEARAHAKGQTGKAPVTFQKMLDAKQPYEDAKAAFAAAKAKSDASTAKAEELLNHYHDPSKAASIDQLFRAHADLKAAYREKWNDNSATEKAQRLLWRKQNAYEGPRNKLAGEISQAEIDAHPARMAAKADLEAANGRLMGLTGEDAVRSAFEARNAAQAEVSVARQDLVHIQVEVKYGVTAITPPHVGTYSDPAAWPSGKLDAARHMDGVAAQRVSNGEQPEHVGDLALHELQHEQGFDGKPDIVSEADLRRGIQNGDTEIWRGDTKEGHTDNMMLGDYHTGLGIRGNGTYAQEGAHGYSTAQSYATNHGRSVDNGRIMHMAIKSGAKIVNHDDLINEAMTFARAAQREIDDAKMRGDRVAVRRARQMLWLATSDKTGASRFAVARGYDAIRVPKYGQMIVLNRAALRVSNRVVKGDYTGFQ